MDGLSITDAFLPGVLALVLMAVGLRPERGTPLGDAVDHPSHYGGESNPYEAIKVIEAWGLGFCLGNAIKYVSRAGRKDPARKIEDLQKASWYLKREIERLERET